MSNTATSLDMRALLRRFMNNVERSSSKDLVLQIAIAAGSVFILAKLLRALAHYVFPRYRAQAHRDTVVPIHLLTVHA